MAEFLAKFRAAGGVEAVAAIIVAGLVILLREMRRRRPLAVVRPEPAPEARRTSAPVALRILVVEDSETLAKLYARILRELDGVEVEVVGSGEEALARVRAEAFDLLVVDVGMPRMSGVELVRRLRDEGSMRPLVHVVIVSGRHPDLLEEMARQCGASGWLAKPATRAVLLEVAGRLLGRDVAE